MEQVDLTYRFTLSEEDERLRVIVDWLNEHRKFIMSTDAAKIIITLNVKGKKVKGEINNYFGED